MRRERFVFVLLALLLGACVPPFLPHMAPTRVARGTITKLEEQWEYEPQCGILAKFFSHGQECLALNMRAWKATLTDSAGATQTFMFFTENGAPGLAPVVGQTATFTLHASPVYKLATCQNVYQAGHCAYVMDYVLEPGRNVAP